MTIVDSFVDYDPTTTFRSATTKRAPRGAVRFDAPEELIARYLDAAEVLSRAEAELDRLRSAAIASRRR
jgi:hypothetical protein